MRRISIRRMLLAAALSVPVGLGAQEYPSQNFRFVCAFPAGSGADVIVRYFPCSPSFENPKIRPEFQP